MDPARCRRRRPAAGSDHHFPHMSLRRFSGNRKDGERALTSKVLRRAPRTVVLRHGGSGCSRASPASGVCLPGESLGRGLPHAIGTITSLQTPVVQEELQQRQVVRAELSPQEEVAAEPAVEVFRLNVVVTLPRDVPSVQAA